MRSCVLATFTLLLSVCAVAKQKTYTWLDQGPAELALTAQQTESWFDSNKATLYRDHVVDLLAVTIGTCRGYNVNGQVDVHTCGAQLNSQGQPVKDANGQPVREQPNFPGPEDYLVIHIVKWKDLVSGKTVQDVDKQTWYVYNSKSSWDDSDYATNFRIFGRKSFYLVYYHFNKDQNASYDMRYTVKAVSKLPAYLDHFVQLGQLVGIGSAGGATPTTHNIWGAHQFTIDYSPSDVTITPTVEPTTGTATDLDAKTLDNEGMYHIDFSVGVPITSVSQLSYVSASNTLVPAKVDKKSLFALFDYYPHAFDIKKTPWSPYPHLVTGVAMAGQPLHQALFAVGYGPVLAHFYAGLLLHTYSLPAGSSCGTNVGVQPPSVSLANKTCPEFSFGLNVAVGAIAQSLQGKSTSKSAKK